jgi:hypothetical protein
MFVMPWTIRAFALLSVLSLFPFSSSAASFAPDPAVSPRAQFTVRGMVIDTTGASIPGAVIELIDVDGAVAGKFQSDATGAFQIVAPHAGRFTLVVSEPGFKTVKTAVTVATPGAGVPKTPATVKVALPVADVATNVEVNADANQDLTSTDNNSDASTLTNQDLKQLPIFDNDYVSAMGAFLDSNVTSTGGSGLIVDGVEANRATVSPSAVQEVQINQDPYSARYYYPGRGQMEIMTKSAADHYHGQFNFYFRDSAMNAQNALAPSKPYEQRRIYEGHVTGPIPRAHLSSFLVSFNRAEEDRNSVVSATVVPTVDNPSGAYSANVPAPTRDTEFSTRVGHLFGDRYSSYIQYSYEDWTGQNQGVGSQTLAAAGYNSEYREDDLTAHVDATYSASLLNQVSLVAEHTSSRNNNTSENPRVSLPGNFVSGSAQADSFATEYNFRLSDVLSWTRGRHLVKTGISIPPLGRRGYDDRTNELGTYTFGPTLAADGVTVLQTTFQNYTNNLPSAFTMNTGDTHFIYHQQEMGAFIQDQIKFGARFSITPGLRYDWQNFLAHRRLGFSPRASFAWVLNAQSKTIVRGGGGIYYDRFGSGPILDLTRYQHARRRSILLSLTPATLPSSGCVPISLCVTLADQPPSITQLMPDAKLPYSIEYGLSIERQLGERATGTISVYSTRGIDAFRSLDINAPTQASDYATRPDPDYARIRQMQPAAFYDGYGMDVSYRGRFNKYFTGFGRYTWSHYESNTGGIGWYPQNQLDPEDEWSNSGYDRRHQFNMYAMLHPDGVLNLAVGVFANTGYPWTVVTGTDDYGDGLFNTRPDGVGRNTETGPNYVDMDVRWGHDFAFTANKADEAPRIGFSAGAFNVLNHVNGSGIDQVNTSSSFGQITSAASARRLQLGMRLQF